MEEKLKETDEWGRKKYRTGRGYTHKTQIGNTFEDGNEMAEEGEEMEGPWDRWKNPAMAGERVFNNFNVTIKVWYESPGLRFTEQDVEPGEMSDIKLFHCGNPHSVCTMKAPFERLEDIFCVRCFTPSEPELVTYEAENVIFNAKEQMEEERIEKGAAAASIDVGHDSAKSVMDRLEDAHAMGGQQRELPDICGAEILKKEGQKIQKKKMKQEKLEFPELADAESDAERTKSEKIPPIAGAETVEKLPEQRKTLKKKKELNLPAVAAAKSKVKDARSNTKEELSNGQEESQDLPVSPMAGAEIFKKQAEQRNRKRNQEELNTPAVDDAASMAESIIANARRKLKEDLLDGQEELQDTPQMANADIFDKPDAPLKKKRKKETELNERIGSTLGGKTKDDFSDGPQKELQDLPPMAGADIFKKHAEQLKKKRKTKEKTGLPEVLIKKKKAVKKNANLREPEAFALDSDLCKGIESCILSLLAMSSWMLVLIVMKRFCSLKKPVWALREPLMQI
eukprot:gnl/MRDRNA2_/MRDRNA2_57996_c0_seq1.p1 gnl/MRDRNA2_/MRDRNA2_57996_c0~~gnl/MRDRNA2_/MRDRNA2_57996_c0_seq1.p1  ORF type:complete len:511 (+),score=128.64 gnl/MRDRNA2_/MRDRNA2_57996_c0_seq1:57-1589(+)